MHFIYKKMQVRSLGYKMKLTILRKNWGYDNLPFGSYCGIPHFALWGHLFLSYTGKKRPIILSMILAMLYNNNYSCSPLVFNWRQITGIMTPCIPCFSVLQVLSPTFFVFPVPEMSNAMTKKKSATEKIVWSLKTPFQTF